MSPGPSDFRFLGDDFHLQLSIRLTIGLKLGNPPATPDPDCAPVEATVFPPPLPHQQDKPRPLSPDRDAPSAIFKSSSSRQLSQTTQE